MIRVATFASQQLSLSQQMRTQSQWAAANIQASSGKQSRTYAGIAINSSRLISLKNMHEGLSSYIANINITDSRLQTMESSVAAIFDIATEVRTLLMEALNAGNAKDAAVSQNTSIMLEEVAARLNASQDGRYLFSGSTIGTPPVDLANFDPDDVSYDANDPTLANAGYYAGDDTVLSVRVDDAVILDYGVLATESGIEALLRGLYLASTAAPTDTARLESALDLMNTAIDELPNIRSRIGTTRSALEQTKAAHSEVQLFTEQEISDIENVDIVQTMTRISALQLQLEASYMMTAQLGSITLLNFLR